MRRKPEDWQEGLKDGHERLGDKQEAPRLAGRAERRTREAGS